MKAPEKYHAKAFNLHGLNGISDRTVDTHLSLYEGYVRATNELNEHLVDLMKDGKVTPEEQPAFAELTRRLGFEYNGMVLHEYYFDNLQAGGQDRPGTHSIFVQAAEDGYGSFERWKAGFSSVGMMRGVGWAVCYLNPANGQLSNQWITLHEHGNVAGFLPILVMDVWEHAYLLDRKPSERKAYIDAFFSNMNWVTIERRMQLGVPAFAKAGRG